MDDTYTTVWFPLYCGSTRCPPSFPTGRLGEFSWDSAWWIFNLVANYANLKYSYMIEDIQAVQRELEDVFLHSSPRGEDRRRAGQERPRALDALPDRLLGG